MPRRPDPALAAVLTKLLVRRGLSQADLARELNVSPTQVSRWRRGLEVPSINRIQAIATFFGVDRETLEQLAGWRDNTVASAQDTPDPEMTALLDAERHGLLADLNTIPVQFWETVTTAQHAARGLAMTLVRTALDLAQQSGPVSMAADDELAPPGQTQRRTDKAENPARNGSLPTALLPAYAN